MQGNVQAAYIIELYNVLGFCRHEVNISVKFISPDIKLDVVNGVKLVGKILTLCSLMCYVFTKTASVKVCVFSVPQL